MNIEVPRGAGIYLVTLSNELPISVNADRPSRAQFCISVTKENCKYGIATSLHRRRNEYYKTFGHDNVLFRPIALLENSAIVETLVGQRLSGFRMLGRTGRKNEWLAGITASEVELAILDSLHESGVDFRWLGDLVQHQKVVHMPKIQNISKTQSHTCAQLVEAAEYLRSVGMTHHDLRYLHHSPGQKETFSSTLRYFGVSKELGGKNLLYANRVVFVASEHKKGKSTIAVLLVEALQKWPL